ncbi:MAG TPA: ABC transporter ATP-binding protein [Dehalococcoidia bacterium]
MGVVPRLLKFVFPYWPRIIVAWLCVFGSAGFVLAIPRIVGEAVDMAVQSRAEQAGAGFGWDDLRPLLIAAGLVVAAAVLRGLFAYGQTYLGEWISQRAAYDIRNRIYDRLQRLSFAYHDRAQTGQIMSRATQDVEGVRMFINMGVLRLMYVVVLLAVAVALMISENWRLALVSFSFFPVIAGVSIFMTMRLRPLWLRIQDEQGRLGTVLQENLTGMRVVKAFGREDSESKKFAKEAKTLFQDSFASNRIQAVNTPLLTGLWMLDVAATMWFGGYEAIHGRLSPGDLTQFVLYLYLLQLPVRSLGWIVNLFARAQSSGQRIFEILDAESAVKEKPDAVELKDITGHVRFENVSFSYDAISAVLKGIDIDAKPGQMVALLGPTGSGKSTVVNLLPRFYDVTDGRITIDGIDIRDVTLASLRRNIGVVQQDVFLFNDTIRANIAYGAVDATQEQIERAAKAARIHDFIMSLPDGYDTWVGERGVTLSGGQKQRVAIARTLLVDPKILIFDDSTSSVDTETEYLIQQALQELMKGRTTFVIAQRLRTVKRADQILVLKDGRIVERGRHEDLLALGGHYRQIYDLELRDQEEALARLARPAGALDTAPAAGG